MKTADTISRRALLSLLAATPVSLAACAPANAPSPGSSSARRRPKAIVIGAGLSGLCTALLLRQQGFEVAVVEAQAHAGGRVATSHPLPGVHVELGATRILRNHLRVQKYAHDLGVRLEPIAELGNRRESFLLGGQRFVGPVSPTNPWPHELGLPPADQVLGVGGLAAKWWTPLVPEVGDTLAADWPQEPARALDRSTKIELLLRRGASPGVVRLLMLGNASGWVGPMTALQSLRLAAVSDFRSPAFRVVGGNDRLPAALAAALGDSVHFDAPVRRIVFGDREARVTLDDGRELAGDWVICTAPLPVLRRLEVEGPLPAVVREAIAAIEPVAVTRVNVQLGGRPWEKDGLSGFMSGEGPIPELWNIAAGDLGTRGILTCYVGGQPARDLSAMSEVARGDLVTRTLETVFPGSAALVERLDTKAWHDDPWAMGGWPCFKPGQLSRFFRPLNAPMGRLVLASDYLSSRVGWMEGALESAERAVRVVTGLSRVPTGAEAAREADVAEPVVLRRPRPEALGQVTPREPRLAR